MVYQKMEEGPQNINYHTAKTKYIQKEFIYLKYTEAVLFI